MDDPPAHKAMEYRWMAEDKRRNLDDGDICCAHLDYRAYFRHHVVVFTLDYYFKAR